MYRASLLETVTGDPMRKIRIITGKRIFSEEPRHANSRSLAQRLWARASSSAPTSPAALCGPAPSATRGSENAGTTGKPGTTGDLGLFQFFSSVPSFSSSLINSLVFDCLNTQLFRSLDTVLHSLEFIGGVALPVYDLADNAKRAFRSVRKRRVARVLLVS
jgi:hypothetical protein